MKLNFKNLIPIFLCFCAHNAFAAKSIEAATKGFGQKISSLALIVAPIGLTISAFYYFFGREDGKQKSAMALAGTIIVVGADAIVQLIRNSFA